MTIAFTLSSLLTQAQDVKIKKGNILLNKTEKIGTQEKRFDGGLSTMFYTFKDINGNSVSVYKVMGESGSTSDYLYVLSTNFNNDKWEVSASDIGGVANKGTVKYLLNNDFWDAKTGIDTVAINLKMANTGTSLSDVKNEKKANEDRVKNIDPFVRRSGEIVKGGPEGTEVIGYVESPDNYLETATTPILRYNIDKNLIAKGKSGILKEERFTTFDGVEHEFTIQAELNELTKPLFLSELVYSLMLNGYIFEGKLPYDPTINIFE